MRSDCRKTFPVNLIIPVQHVLESVLPVHCDKRHAIAVKEKCCFINYWCWKGWKSTPSDY